MMRVPGDLVEDFVLPDQEGTPWRLTRALVTGPVVLFFFPAAMTPGCTAESCHFRDLADEFAGLGAHRVGISPDPVDRQRRFAQRYGLDFPLLSDEYGVVARQFGTRRGWPVRVLRTRRVTFVIGVDRRLVAVVGGPVSMDDHADLALRALRDAARGR